MMFPEIFTCFHSNDLQNHILLALGIMPEETYFKRCWQLNIIRLSLNIELSQRDFQNVCIMKFGNKIKTFYRLGSSDSNGKKYAEEWKEKGIIAIGWKELGDLRQYDNGKKFDTDKVKEKLLETNNNYKTIAPTKAKEIKNFYKSDENSIFVVADGEKIIGLVDNIGDYEFDSNNHMSNYKKCHWSTFFQDNIKFPNKNEWYLTSCVKITNKENLLFLYNLYYWNERNISTKIAIANNKTKNPLNTILYGPPGTGKTYNTVVKAIEIIDSDIIKYDDEGNISNYDEVKGKFDEAKKAGQIEFITFHQSYAYEEFVEGIKPDLGEVWGKSTDGLTYKGSDGIFKIICKEASRNKDKKYVLIIDEINRGNISKIFGELITLIEEDKRESFSVRLPYSHEEFTVPKNLYIIGTMNTSDRSIASIDIALRRRFTFKEMMPDSKLVADFEVEFNKKFEELNNRIRILLDRDHQIGHSYFIKTNYNNENNNNNIKTLKEIWFNSVMPLLNEYFYNDWDKLKLIIPGFIKAIDIPQNLKDECESAYEFKSFDEMKDDIVFIEALNQAEYKEKE